MTENASVNASGDRIQFEDFTLDQQPGSRCAVKVVLGWKPGDDFTGESDGVDSPTGQLRCAANATARALERAFGEDVQLSVLGVKAIKAFDAVLVVVSLTSHARGQDRRLVGSCMVEDEIARGAALAVLNATNRLLGNVIASR